MNDDLKIVDKNNNFDFVDIEKQSGFARKEPTVTIRDMAIYISCSAVVKMNLKDYKTMRLSLRETKDYKIMFRGTIQNIGETNNLRRRLKEKEIEEIPIDHVEYSDMSHANDEQRKDCEWELLEDYKKEFYHYPPHNKQGGRKLKN